MALQLVNISQLRAGQVVASAVTNTGGAVLCPIGFKLTEAAIERLSNAGVESVIVEVNERRNKELELRLGVLEDRFRGIDDPIMLQIKATIEQRLSFLKL